MRVYYTSPPREHEIGDLVSTLRSRSHRSELERCTRLPTEAKRFHYLVGRQLARHVIARESGYMVDAPVLEEDSRGRPRLARRGHGINADLNTSHHGGRVCIAWNSRGRVGVDVQTPVAGWPEIARRFFDPQERASTWGLPSSQRAMAFAALWAVKEAIWKTHGTGPRYPLPYVGIIEDHRRPFRGRSEELKWAVRPVRGAMVAVAWDSDSELPDTDDWVIEIGLSDLCLS